MHTRKDSRRWGSPAGRFLRVAALIVAAVSTAQGQWVSPPGDGWFQVNVYHHDTRRQFNALSELQRFPEDGHAVTTSVYFTGALGLLPGIDTWVQAPVHRLEFNDIIGGRVSTGLGDPRVYLRLGPGLFGRNGWPIAVRGGVKFVGGDFPIDAEIIPLGEGQRDWELMLELGWSFYPMPMYLGGWAGYRWREANERAARHPGDERFAYLALGGQWRGFTYKFAGEVLRGDPLVAQGISLPTARRQMLQVLPTVGYGVGPGVFEVGVRVPLSGRNLPAGPALTLGYFFSWN